MFCKECGNKIDEDALFCAECGTPVQTSQTNNASHAENQSSLSLKSADSFFIISRIVFCLPIFTLFFSIFSNDDYGFTLKISGFDLIFGSNWALFLESYVRYIMIAATVSTVIGVIKPNKITPFLSIAAYILFITTVGVKGIGNLGAGFYLGLVVNGILVIYYEEMKKKGKIGV